MSQTVQNIDASRSAGDRLAQDLRDAVRHGTLRPGTRLAPVRELAERYGVTASKAQRVVRRLAKDGLVVCRRGDGSYIAGTSLPVTATRPLVTGVAPTGILLSEFSFQEFMAPCVGDFSGGAEFMRGVEEILGGGPQAYHLIPPTVADVAAAVAAPGLERLLICQSLLPGILPHLEHCHRRGGQVVFIEELPEKVSFGLHLRTNAASGIARAVRHLHGLGHRRFSFLTWEPQAGPLNLGWLAEREAACLHQLGEFGLTPQILRLPGVLDGKAALPGLREWLRNWRASADRPSALVCVNDGLAERLFSLAIELDLRIPGELSVTGFDDAPTAIALGLTTVHRHFRDLGRLAARLVGQTRATSVTIKGELALEPQLVIRRSTGPCQPNGMEEWKSGWQGIGVMEQRTKRTAP